MDMERAMARTKAADEATAKGESWGPLHGLPMTVKDAFVGYSSMPDFFQG